MIVIRDDIINLFSQHAGPIPYAFSFGDADDISFIIIGCLHGNEIVGAEVARRLYERQDTVGSRILTVLGNPEAFRRNVRYIDEDLNRKFSDPVTGDTLEAGRAREMEKLFRHIAASGRRPLVIDLHTMSLGTDPSVICNAGDAEAIGIAEHTSLCDHIMLFQESGDIMLSGLARRCGLPYIAVECGQHIDPVSAENGFSFVEEVFTHMHALKETDRTVRKHKKDFYEFKRPIPVTPGLRFTKTELGTVTPVRKGEVYARDDGGDIAAEYDCAILFPSKTIKQTDADAGFLCLPVESGY